MKTLRNGKKIVISIIYIIHSRVKKVYSIGDEMANFELSIQLLSNGWAELFLLIDGYETTLCFENVPKDALYSLLDGAIGIVSNIESSVIFPNRSEKACLVINNLDDNSCRIDMQHIDLVLSKKQFCKAILRMFDKYIFANSKNEYSENWCSFPEAELKRLRDLYSAL